MKRLRTGVVVLMIAIAFVAVTPVGAQAAAPRVTVNPFTALVGGDTVTVVATGLPAHAAVDIVECANATHFGDDGERIGCDVIRTVTTNGGGALHTALTVADPVYSQEEFGDPVPIYCRLDGCRMFAEWTDASGFHSIGTKPMHFVGGIATIVVGPSTNLVDGSRVHVSGSARGSTGHFVTVVEHLCFQIIQGSGCTNGTIPLGTFRLTASDTYSGYVTVFRTLADGGDCVTDTFFGPCTLSPIVLNSSGDPDDSFGVSRIGQPAADLSFIP